MSLFDKVTGPQACSFIKKTLWSRLFPVNFTELFKNTFFTQHFRATASVRKNSVLLLPSRHTTSFQRLYDIYATSLTSYRRRIDVETTSCVYWVGSIITQCFSRTLKLKEFTSKSCKSAYWRLIV